MYPGIAWELFADPSLGTTELYWFTDNDTPQLLLVFVRILVLSLQKLKPGMPPSRYTEASELLKTAYAEHVECRNNLQITRQRHEPTSLARQQLSTLRLNLQVKCPGTVAIFRL
jgi:hypothetical protein